MENIRIFDQTAPLLAIILIILAFCLAIIFYIWSLRVLKKIESQIIRMKQHVNNLENLSQYIYETAYFDMKDSVNRGRKEDRTTPDSRISLDEFKELQSQIQHLEERQAEINQILYQKEEKKPEKQKETPSNKKGAFMPSLQPGEEDKYEKISELIVMYLNDLLQEKEQVTAQELVYAMPNKYSLADIYRTLEIMKERGKINWEDKSIHPKSFLILP